MKKCRICREEKPYDCFGPDNRRLDGKRGECYECRKKEYYENHNKMLEQKKKSYQIHKNDPLKKLKSKEYYQENSEAIKKRANDHYYNNKEKHKLNSQLYRARPEIKKKRNELHSKRIKTDINYVIGRRLRSKLNKTLKLINISQTILDLLGCNLENLRKHIESQFTDGMTWEKFLNGEIHIDHIIPCCAHNLSDLEERKKCFHYTNLQPLWESDNCSKAAQDKKLSVKIKKS